MFVFPWFRSVLALSTSRVCETLALGSWSDLFGLKNWLDGVLSSSSCLVVSGVALSLISFLSPFLALEDHLCLSVLLVWVR